MLRLMSLELDHVFCFVTPGDRSIERALAGGWTLDDGIEHSGQGTRNRRLWLHSQYIEFVWLSSRVDARANPLRLDRRADWRDTGACPFGIGLRGQLTDAQRMDLWAYRPPYAPGATIWIHRSNEDALDQPFLFVMEASPDVMERYLPRNRVAATPALLMHTRPAAIREIRLTLSRPPQALLACVTPSVLWMPGSSPRLEVVVGEGPGKLELTDVFALVG
jgi:Glyoxalase-like domain